MRYFDNYITEERAFFKFFLTSKSFLQNQWEHVKRFKLGQLFLTKYIACVYIGLSSSIQVKNLHQKGNIFP